MKIYKLEYREKDKEWQAFYEGSKKEVEKALEWNVNNAKTNNTGKEFRII